MSAILPAINNVTTYKCTHSLHNRCTGHWWSFTRHSKVWCACKCHQLPRVGSDLFDTIQKELL